MLCKSLKYLIRLFSNYSFFYDEIPMLYLYNFLVETVQRCYPFIVTIIDVLMIVLGVKSSKLSAISGENGAN